MKEHFKVPLTLATINVVECYDVVPQFITNCKESNWRIYPILELKYGFDWGHNSEINWQQLFYYTDSPLVEEFIEIVPYAFLKSNYLATKLTIEQLWIT